MSNPEVSVIIPSFNHECFVEAAVRSVLEQTFSKLELIVIDDGSSDGSVALLESLASEDSRVRVICQANAGSHATINRGLEMASAPWVAVLNSDDCWEPQRLEVMLSAARRSGADFLFSDSVLIDSSGEPISDTDHWWNISVQRMRERVRAHGVCDGVLYGNLSISTSNFLFRRTLLSSVGYFRRLRYNLDWDYLLRCLFTVDVKVEFVDQPLLLYRLHGKNAILSGMPTAAIEAQVITRRLYREQFGVPDSLILSHQRHDRLLRRFLASQARRFRQSFDEIEADRNRLADLLNERQILLERERDIKEVQMIALREDVAAIEFDRDRIASMMSKRQAMFEHEREVVAAANATRYRESIEIRAERDDAQCREARVLITCGQERPGRSRLGGNLNRRFVRWLHANFPASLRTSVLPLIEGNMKTGQVRRKSRVVPVPGSRIVKVAAHVHVYYLDLAAELIEDALRVVSLQRLVITGPWTTADLEPFFGEVRRRCIDVRVLTVENRGKDVGGLIAAIRLGELLDSDVFLKIHSKKSHNPPSYFDAISKLFGSRIENGDEWRRALIDPLASTPQRVEDILGAFQDDPTVGMIGAGAFVTASEEANADLSRAIYERFNLSQGLPFVAGTMFWMRSSLLKPLIDREVEVSDFSLDSRAVEGGLEHVMERALGSLVLSRGFDLLGVE